MSNKTVWLVTQKIFSADYLIGIFWSKEYAQLESDLINASKNEHADEATIVEFQLRAA